MPGRVIGHITFKQVPESVRNYLKLKEDTYLCNLTKSFLQENKINPEALDFDIIKISKNEIGFAQSNGTGQPTDNHPSAKMEITNVK